MAVTRAWLDRRLKVWVPRLGLERWDIRVEWGEPCDETADASTWMSDFYDRARIKFAKDFKTWEPVFAEQTLVHELLHLTHRDVDQVFKDLDGQLHRDVQAMVDARYKQELEGFIDRLASRLVEIGGADA